MAAGSRAQAPAWVTTAANTTALAPGITTPNGASVQAVAADADGNVFVAGFFDSSVNFGSTTLTAVGSGHQSFVAKWSPTTNTFVWALQTTTTDSFGQDEAFALTVQEHDVYVGGIVLSTNASFGGLGLTSPGTLGQGSCAYVAKITDAGATGSFRWVTAATGRAYNAVKYLEVRGNEVYVGGYYSAAPLLLSSLSLPNGGSGNSFDIFVAKLRDAGSSVSAAWVQRAGGAESEELKGMAVQGSHIYLSGSMTRRATFGPFTIGSTTSGLARPYLARLTDTGTGSSFDWAVQAVTTPARPSALVVNGPNCYVAGDFTYSFEAGSLNLPGNANADTYVAKYTDTGTTATPVWAVAGSSATGEDTPGGLAIRANSLYVSGYFVGATASFGSITLTNSGAANSSDVYLAKLTDAGASATWNWAQRGGGPRADGTALPVLSGQRVYVGGAVSPPATFSSTITSPFLASVGFLASVEDATLAALPVFTSISPDNGPAGTSVTITGTGFAGTTSLLLNGVAVTGFVVNATGTSITFTVPAGATGGPLAVVGPGGTVYARLSFCVQLVAQGIGAERCGPGSLVLGASGAPTGGSYAWYTQATGGTPISGATGASYTTPSLGATTTYYVAIGTGSGSTGCEGPRTAVPAVINLVPTVTVAASGPLTFCQGGSVTLTATGSAGTTYAWSSGQTTASITVTQGGSYTVVAITASSCRATSPASLVTVNPLASTPLVTRTLLPNGTVRLSSNAASGNQWYLGGNAIPSATLSTYTVTGNVGNGVYTVITTGPTGCSSLPSAPQTVVVTGTRQPAWAAQVQLLPNPAQAQLRVMLPTTTPGATISVVNALGQVVVPATAARVLEVGTLARGLYAVRVQIGGEVVTKRLVLE